MGKKELLESLPPEGFIKVTRPEVPQVTSAQRAQLIRKGNEFMLEKDFNQAKRIFVAMGYTDGMIRLGDLYLDSGEPFLAFQMYKLAPSPEKAEKLILRMAGAIKKWLKETPL